MRALSRPTRSTGFLRIYIYIPILCFLADWLVSIRMRFEYPLRWCTYSAVWLLHSWCHVKLLPSRRTLCVHPTTTHQFTTLFSRNHIRRVHMFLTVYVPHLIYRMLACLHVLPWSFKYNPKQKEAQSACAESTNQGVNYHSKEVTHKRTTTTKWNSMMVINKINTQRNELGLKRRHTNPTTNSILLLDHLR